jgi:hypothetical protein
VPVVSLADADDTNKMPAFGLAESTVSTNGSIEVTSNGTLAGIDTSSYALGDILYISTTAGSLTNDPSGLEASKVQNIGMVQRVHASNGSIKVGGAGRTNATPNLNDGNIFVGNSSNKSVSDAFTDVLNDQAGINSSANATAITIDSSENVGIGTSSPTADLSVGSTSTSSGDVHLRTTKTAFSITPSNTDAGGILLDLGWVNGGQGPMKFGIGSAEKMRIDSLGNVGIGTTSPNAAEFSATPNGVLEVEGTKPVVYLSETDTTDAHAWLGVSNGVTYLGSTGSGLQIRTGTDSASTKVTIDTSGNVGIGTTSPTEALSISSNDGLVSTTSTASKTAGVLTGGYLIYSGDGSGAGDGNRAGIQSFSTNSVGSTYDLRFYTSNGSTNLVEGMRIDSSGNVLVNKTASGSLGTAGFEFASNNTLRATKGSSAPAEFNRLTNDGDIAIFYKDTSPVGSISSNGGSASYNSNNGVIYLGHNQTNHFKFLTSQATGQPRFEPSGDNAIDVGRAALRFKDLYLSGGVHLGGTGSANKLDDYEEGTWTGTVSDSTATTVTWGVANYTKIGNMVYASFRVLVSEQNIGSNYIILYGPFAQHTSSIEWIGFCNNYNTGNRESGLIINNSSGNTNEWFVGWQSTSGSSKNIRGLIIYQTTS